MVSFTMRPQFLNENRGRHLVVGLIVGFVCSISIYNISHSAYNSRTLVSPLTAAPTADDSKDWDTYKRCFRPERESRSSQRAADEYYWETLYLLRGAQLTTLVPLENRYTGGGIPWSVVEADYSSLLVNEIPREDIQWSAQAARWSIENPPEEDGYLHVLVGKLPCVEHGLCALPWLIRPNSTDMRSLWNHFLANEYGWLVEAQNFDPEYILDAGGVGMAPVFLALLYPRATILRLDPHPSNFHIGAINSLRLPNIKQVNLGLWDKETTLQMCDNVDIAWGEGWPFEGSAQQAFFSREPSDPPCKKVAVDGIHVARLSLIMKTFNIPRFDLMKVDIEGAEARAFTDPGMKRIISQTTLFVVENHDRFFPGSSKSVRRAFDSVGGFVHFGNSENEVWIQRGAVKACFDQSDVDPVKSLDLTEGHEKDPEDNERGTKHHRKHKGGAFKKKHGRKHHGD